MLLALMSLSESKTIAKAIGPLTNAGIGAAYVILKHLIKLYLFKGFLS